MRIQCWTSGLKHGGLLGGLVALSLSVVMLSKEQRVECRYMVTVMVNKV